LGALLLAAPALAQTTQARRLSSALLDLSQASPATTSPTAALAPGYNSYSVPGALRLSGCAQYQITMCAVSGTIAATGTIQVYYWPDAMAGMFTPTAWSRNPGLDETVSTGIATACAGSTCPCITFPAHAATSFGWIYAAPASVTTTSGAPKVKITVEAACMP
jgi:hypothetical protein